ncbi:ribosomal protein S5 domain 2-type protein [Podospora conica]|nr:ribosomal protein S5 domain 2-type protein [Schizothecium conicum]
MMASSRQPLTAALRCVRPSTRGQWLPLEQRFRALRLQDSPCDGRRHLSLESDSRPSSGWEELKKAAASQPDAIQPDIETPKYFQISLRALPTSPSYFTRTPLFNDLLLNLERLLRTYGNLPTLPPTEVERVLWKSSKDYKMGTGEVVKATEYRRCITAVKRLHQIHPDLKPAAVAEAVAPFKREIQSYASVPIPITVDSRGRARGVGRRKSSTAQAWVVEGTGEVQINGKILPEYFPRMHDRSSAIWPLHVTQRLDKYNVWALVKGGGTTGQAEALTLAIAKALAAHEPALKTPLRKAGCITRDPRRVERKKHGHVKARKMPAWVKR